MTEPKHNSQSGVPSAHAVSAFTLLETMITVALFGLVVAGAIAVFIMCNKFWHATSLSMETSQMADLAMQRLVCGVGSNGGLRSASMVVLQTNAYGHPYPFLSSYKYWENGTCPPPADNPNHYTHVGCVYGTDGSWRLILSNAFDGVNCVDYNAAMRFLLFCPDTNQTTAARSKRISICSYVSDARVTNDANGMINIRLTVEKRDGMFVSSNQVSSFIKKRN